jgi:hypothetical protein
VAQFKFTVLLLPSGPQRITSGPMEAGMYKSEYSVTDPEMKELLSQSTGAKKNAKRKKKKTSGAKEGGDADPTAAEA